MRLSNDHKYGIVAPFRAGQATIVLQNQDTDRFVIGNLNPDSERETVRIGKYQYELVSDSRIRAYNLLYGDSAHAFPVF